MSDPDLIDRVIGGPFENTDQGIWRTREIWRKTPGDFYSDSIHVTADGGIGIDCGGHVIVASVRTWHSWGLAASQKPDLPDRVRALEARIQLLEESTAERFSRLSKSIGLLESMLDHEVGERISALEAFNEGFKRPEERVGVLEAAAACDPLDDEPHDS